MPKQQGKDHYGHSWKPFFPLSYERNVRPEDSSLCAHENRVTRISEYKQIKSVCLALPVQGNCKRKSLRIGASLLGRY